MADRYFGILQKISVGNHNFDGTDPGTDPVIGNGINKYPTATHGGEFDPAHVNPIMILHVFIKMGLQDTWVLSITDGTDTVQLASGTNEAEVSLYDVAILPVNWKLTLVTTGLTTGAMEAYMDFERSHVLP